MVEAVVMWVNALALSKLLRRRSIMSTALAAIEFFVLSGSVFEAPAFVAGLDDVAMVSETIEQSRWSSWRR